ncbi:Transmembrane protein 42 [Coemansia spiralis]|nr:Transmembrane protein 42 [Coemansia spiralis]
MPAIQQRVAATSVLFAALAGLFAALGSVGAKLTVALDAGPLVGAVYAALPGASAQVVAVAARALLAGAAAACNVLMWLFFTKALRHSDSTARVMVMQTVSNFAATAICGVYLFGDALSLQWWAGASLIAAGLAMLEAKSGTAAADATSDKKTQ